MPNPVRLLSPASIGQQKSRHENSLLLFPHSIPMSRPHASSHQAQTSWSAELPVHVPCTHFFYALHMIMAGYVGIPCLQLTLQNKGDHQQLQQRAHNNKTFEVREHSILSPASIGQQKADIKTLFFFLPRSLAYPCHVRAQAAIKPRHHGRQSCLCPAPISFMHWTW